MSGGHFGYSQQVVNEIADEIEKLALSPEFEDYPEGIKIEFMRGMAHLRLGYVYAQRIDWLLSGDDSEATFLTRLKSDLAEVRGG